MIYTHFSEETICNFQKENDKYVLEVWNGTRCDRTVLTMEKALELLKQIEDAFPEV